MIPQPRTILSGLVVLERADRPCVSICGSLLAELGATVLQVPGADSDIDLTDAARATARQRGAHGKMILRDPAKIDAAAWQELVARADIILRGHRAHERLAQQYQRGIVCIFSSFGIDAPAGTPHAGETVLQALGGMMAATGAQGGAPERANVPIVEMFTGLNATTAILAALRAGPSAILDIAAFDSAMGLLATFVSTVASGRSAGYRIGCAHHLCSPWNVYRAADGWIQLCSTTDEHWRAVTRLLGRDDLADDPRFARSRDRLQNAAAVDQVIADWAAGQSADNAVRSLLASGLPVGRVRTVPDVIADADLRARGMVVADGSADGAVARVGSFLGASLGDTARDPAPATTIDLATALATLTSRAAPPAPPAQKTAAPLQGIRVVEIGAYTAGPLAGRYLADLGAEVIKVESVGGEITRSWAPKFGAHSGYFANCNLGKASVVLDLKNAADLARFVALVRTADVLLENLRPGALDNLGLGPDALLGANARLIYCSVSGFGRAAGSRPALDSVVQAEGGLMCLVGSGDRPQRVGISIADQAAAHAAPLLILAALRRREMSGTGGHVDLSMQDVLAWITGLAWPDGDPALVSWSVLEVADGWVAARGGRPSEPIIAQIAALTRDDAVALLRRNSVEAVGILEMGEAFTHEAVRRRGLVQVVDADGGAGVPILSSPYRIGLPASSERLPGPPGADFPRIFQRPGVE